jgi:hypothetical protein
MPRGRKGEKRIADVIGATVLVARIAAGEIGGTKTEKFRPHSQAAQADARDGGGAH